MFGSWAGNAIAVVAVISCLGAMNGLILLSGQVPMAAEMDGLAPKAFGKLNKNHAPVFGLVVSGLIAIVFTAMNFTGGDLVKVYTQLLLISTVTTLVPYAFSAAAEMKWLMLDKGKIPVLHFSRQLAVAVMAMVYAIFAFYGAGADQVYWGFMLIVFGIPLYLYVLRRRQREGLQAGGRVTNEEYPATSPGPDS